MRMLIRKSLKLGTGASKSTTPLHFLANSLTAIIAITLSSLFLGIPLAMAQATPSLAKAPLLYGQLCAQTEHCSRAIGAEFPPKSATPGVVGDENCSPFVLVVNAANVVYDAPMMAFAVDAREINFPNGHVDYSR